MYTCVRTRVNFMHIIFRRVQVSICVYKCRDTYNECIYNSHTCSFVFIVLLYIYIYASMCRCACTYALHEYICIYKRVWFYEGFISRADCDCDYAYVIVQDDESQSIDFIWLTFIGSSQVFYIA